MQKIGTLRILLLNEATVPKQSNPSIQDYSAGSVPVWLKRNKKQKKKAKKKGNANRAQSRFLSNISTA